MKQCTACGMKYPDTSNFCPRCGGRKYEALNSTVETRGRKNETVAVNNQSRNVEYTPRGNQGGGQATGNNAYNGQRKEQETIVAFGVDEDMYDSKGGFQAGENIGYSVIDESVVSVKEFLLFFLKTAIPIYGLIVFISTAIGKDKKQSLVNYARAAAIITGISVVLSVLINVLMMVLFASMSR